MKGECTHNPCSEIPQDDRSRQSHYISHPPRKVEQQEYIPCEPTDQTRRVERNTPPWIPNLMYSHAIHPWIFGVIGNPPGRDQGRNRHDVRQRARGRGDEGYCHGGEPPVLRRAIVIRAELKFPELSSVGLAPGHRSEVLDILLVSIVCFESMVAACGGGIGSFDLSHSSARREELSRCFQGRHEEAEISLGNAKCYRRGHCCYTKRSQALVGHLCIKETTGRRLPTRSGKA